MKPRRDRRRPEAGMSLVELMITMVIGAIVASSVFVFFNGQQRIYETQNGLLNVQQNVWSALETLTRHVRAAGGGMLGCLRADNDSAGPDTGDPPPSGATTPLTGLRAWRSDLGATRIPPLWIRNGAAGAPDTLTVAYGEGAFGTYNDATLASVFDRPTADLIVGPNEALGFRTNEFALVVDMQGQINGDHGCTLLRVTSVDAATNRLFHATTSTWNPGTDAVVGYVPFPYPATTQGVVRNFGQLIWVQFAIDATGAPDQPPRLTMNRLDGNAGPQVLAEGIEDLQIAYACDMVPAGAPDGVLTEGTGGGRATDEWTFNAAGDVEPAGCQRPAAVRITIVARSLTPDATLNGRPGGNAKPAAEDGLAGPEDLFRHRVMTSTVYLRN